MRPICYRSASRNWKVAGTNERAAEEQRLSTKEGRGGRPRRHRWGRGTAARQTRPTKNSHAAGTLTIGANPDPRTVRKRT
jgi:hypothetical protein